MTFSEALQAFLAAKLEHAKATMALGLEISNEQQGEERLKETAKRYCKTRRAFENAIAVLELHCYGDDEPPLATNLKRFAEGKLSLPPIKE